MVVLDEVVVLCFVYFRAVFLLFPGWLPECDSKSLLASHGDGIFINRLLRNKTLQSRY